MLRRPRAGYGSRVTADDQTDHAEPEAVASFATEGEAEVAQAKLRAYGVESALDDQVEGGSVPVDAEDSVVVEVRAADAADAREILAEVTIADDQLPDG
jgi:hypothetical protein